MFAVPLRKAHQCWQRSKLRNFGNLHTPSPLRSPQFLCFFLCTCHSRIVYCPYPWPYSGAFIPHPHAHAHGFSLPQLLHSPSAKRFRLLFPAAILDCLFSHLNVACAGSQSLSLSSHSFMESLSTIPDYILWKESLLPHRFRTLPLRIEL